MQLLRFVPHNLLVRGQLETFVLIWLYGRVVMLLVCVKRTAAALVPVLHVVIISFGLHSSTSNWSSNRAEPLAFVAILLRKVDLEGATLLFKFAI